MSSLSSSSASNNNGNGTTRCIIGTVISLVVLVVGFALFGLIPSINFDQGDIGPIEPVLRPPPGPLPNGKYNYSEVLRLSYLFYEAQRSGKLPSTNRIAWRSDSALDDGKDHGLDLTGGWYDGGDHMKFALPMAWSTTVLNWGLIEYQDAYLKAGEWENAVDGVRWPMDFLMKANPEPLTFYCQVGDSRDHGYWGPSERMRMRRPSLLTNGAEPPAEAAAALASGYMVMKDIDGEYAEKLLSHSRQLFDLAMDRQTIFNVSLPFYRSVNYQDELAWAAAWLYRATGEGQYLETAKSMYNKCCRYWSKWAFSWENKGPGAQLLLYQLTKDEEYKVAFTGHMEYWHQDIQTTPKGLAFYNPWGPNRYAANTAFLSLLAADWGINTEVNREWGKKQIDYILGDCCGGIDPTNNQPYFSYVIGFGNNFPRAPHHRGSTCNGKSCACTNRPNAHVLLGAMVGGPDARDNYVDDCHDVQRNEVAVDYNAGLTSAAAALKHIYYDDLPPLPPVPPVVVEEGGGEAAQESKDHNNLEKGGRR